MAANGLPLADWAMTRLDLLGALGGLIAPAANWALANRQMRWLLEKTLGIAQGRKLPRVASRSFLRRAARRRLTRPARRSGQKVLYFVDVYANYFDPQLAEALVAVLEHNGIAVYVHPEQKQAGMPSIACGALDHARQTRRTQRRHPGRIGAARLPRRGHRAGRGPVPDPRISAVGRRRRRPAGGRQQQRGGQLPLEDAHAGPTATRFQAAERRPWATIRPAILRALQVGSPGESLLGPDSRACGCTTSRAGCSGMAGTFGLLHKNYRSSLRAGWKLISRLRDPDPASRRHRVQHLQDADGTGHHQTDHPPHQAAGPLLRPDARDRAAARVRPARS